MDAQRTGGFFDEEAKAPAHGDIGLSTFSASAEHRKGGKRRNKRRANKHGEQVKKVVATAERTVAPATPPPAPVSSPDDNVKLRSVLYTTALLTGSRGVAPAVAQVLKECAQFGTILYIIVMMISKFLGSTTDKASELTKGFVKIFTMPDHEFILGALNVMSHESRMRVKNGLPHDMRHGGRKPISLGVSTTASVRENVVKEVVTSDRTEVARNISKKYDEYNEEFDKHLYTLEKMGVPKETQEYIIKLGMLTTIAVNSVATFESSQLTQERILALERTEAVRRSIALGEHIGRKGDGIEHYETTGYGGAGRPAPALKYDAGDDSSVED